MQSVKRRSSYSEKGDKTLLGLDMKIKTLIFLFILMFMFSGQFVLTKRDKIPRENSYARNSVSPIPGVVMIIDLKSINIIPAIEKINTISGRYIERRKYFEEIVSFDQNERTHLLILDTLGHIIYETEFYFSKIITIPPLPSDFHDPITPSVLTIDEPEASVVIPFFNEAAFIVVYNSNNFYAPAIKKIGKIKYQSFFLMPEAYPNENGKFHVLIISSNFNSNNMSSFINASNSIKQFLLSSNPFLSFSSQIEINIYTNTEDLGCYNGCWGIDRLICCDSSKVISAAASSGYLYDEIIVVHNTAEYGGGGYREQGDAYRYNSYNTYAVTYGGAWKNEVAVHEFGHSFGNLCDEYSYTTEGYTYTPCVNCRASCNDWISITSVCQAGCDAKSEYFRPEDSIMLSLSYPYYNQASIKAIYYPDGLEKRLKYFISQYQYRLILTSGIGGTTSPSPGTYTYDEGTQVTITAIPDNGYEFSGWSGDASGTANPLSISIDSDKSIKANFAQQTARHTLTITTETGGTTNPPPGSYTYDEGTQVAITAIADSGYRFSGWSGNASGTTNPITITMDSDKSITASFIRLYKLTITAGQGGTTDPVPGTHIYDEGTEVTITAIAETNYRFGEWSGNASGTNNPIIVTMNSDKSITASFIRLYKLTLASEEHGTTEPAPGLHIYDEGTEVTVTAIPDTHYRFNGWSGNVSSGKENDNPLTITMNSDKSLTASFLRIIYPPLNFGGEKVLNYSLSQDEYINVLTWEANPDNENIEKYRIYQIEEESRSLLIELDANSFKYWHRNVEKEKQYTYALIAVNNESREGDAAYISIK